MSLGTASNDFRVVSWGNRRQIIIGDRSVATMELSDRECVVFDYFIDQGMRAELNRAQHTEENP